METSRPAAAAAGNGGSRRMRRSFWQGRFPTAASLAALAIEEAGKASISRELALASNEQDLKEAWLDYRSHTRKNVMWLFVELIESGARQLDDFRPMFDPESVHPELLDHIKQLGFYS
jgi:AbiV family abortive infection protein